MIEPLCPDSLDPFNPDSFVISVEVHIVDIEPKISRSLELPVKLHFAQLHEVLQAAFGWTDSHLHQFNVGGLTRRIPRQIGVNYPRCLAGSRSGPPEDVGGCSGYADFLEAWGDPEHEEHKAVRRWAGRKFDPERFDLEATNKAIARAMRAAKGSYRFRYDRS
jgi:hypothetical protein